MATSDSTGITAGSLQAANPKSTQASGPTALLLTAAPVEALQREAQHISTAGRHLDVINTILFFRLSGDRQANALRASLVHFNHVFYPVVHYTESIFASARNFYSADDQDFLGKSLERPITRTQVEALLDPVYQKNSLDVAEKIISSCESTSRILQEDIIPLLDGLGDEIQSFVEEYIDRDQQMQARALLWLPGLFLDYLWGPLDPPTRKVSEIEPLSEDFAGMRALIRTMPSFLDNIQTHFRRLSEVAKTGIDVLGYKTSADLERLYRDRVVCVQYVRMMQTNWDTLIKAFNTKSFGGVMPDILRV